MKTILTVPGWLKITTSKSRQIQTVVIGLDKFRVGQNVEVEIGREVTVWTDKGRFDAVVTKDGLSVAGLHADGSRQSV